MELKYLQTFKTILETGSFVSAAHHLNYTQSTVTFQIQQLEQELGVKLFEKIGRKMTLTQQGAALVPLVEEVLQGVERLYNFGKETRALTGTLRVAAPVSLITYRMQPVLRAFHEAAPGVRLILEAMNCYEVKEHVMRGGADLGIQYDTGGYRTGAVVERFCDYPMALVAAPDADGAQLDFQTHHQRKDLCLLINDPDAIYQKRLDQLCYEKDIVFSAVMQVGSLEAIKRSVASGLGVAILPQVAIEEELAQGTLRAVSTPLDGETITAIALYHKNKSITPAMELFLRLCREKLDA